MPNTRRLRLPQSLACTGAAGVLLAYGIGATGAFAQSLPKVSAPSAPSAPKVVTTPAPAKVATSVPKVTQAAAPVVTAAPKPVSQTTQPVVQAAQPVAQAAAPARKDPPPGDPPAPERASSTSVDVQVAPGPAAAELVAVVQPAAATPAAPDSPAVAEPAATQPVAEDQPSAAEPAAPAPVAIDQAAALEQALELSAPTAPARSTFSETLVYQQSDPTNDIPETAGVQTASIAAPDRTSIVVAIAPPVTQIISTIVAILPSTGGPSAVALATALLGLGGVGVWLRRSGRIGR
jgi:nicotinate-nucleotide--dimethylbenzimidazole phosphoribosyltransferase